jgi:beta-glucosidase/6-phospho-beta-glucosidase/beta-galactosidase
MRFWPVSALVVVLLTLAAPASAQQPTVEVFPDGFLWGTATAGFQVEAGGSPSNADRRSDWWAFTHDPGLIRDGVVSGDRVERGPGFLGRSTSYLAHARKELHNNAIRIGIEWSRIFPRSTASVRTGRSVSLAELRRLDRLADRKAVLKYDDILRQARIRRLEPMVTLNHYVLPLWIHDPLAVRRAFAGRDANAPVPGGLRRAGWLGKEIVGEFRKFAAYAAWKFGRRVPLWATLNEPVVLASQAFVSIPGVTGVKAPAVLSYAGVIQALERMVLANAAAYDAVHDWDAGAQVGFVHNLLDWRPNDPSRAEDVEAAGHADQLYNRLFMDAAVRGVLDENANGAVDAGEERASLRGKADFIGVNHYSPARAQALGAPVSPRLPLFDFLPKTTYRGHGSPEGEPCPTTCSDFGWEIDPAGMRTVLNEAASYGLPLYVTENGIDDPEDDQRPDYLYRYLQAVHAAIRDGADVRGYYHWSLVDNYEWAEGFTPRFGLYSYDPRTLELTRRPSGRLYRDIARNNALANAR